MKKDFDINQKDVGNSTRMAVLGQGRLLVRVKGAGSRRQAIAKALMRLGEAGPGKTLAESRIICVRQAQEWCPDVG